jgi:hypothetical protein
MQNTKGWENMQTSVNSITSAPKKVLKSSSLGISSFVLTLFADFFILMGILSNIGKEETSLGFFGIMFWVLIVPSSILAIVDLTKPNRKKTLPKLALIFGVGIIAIMIVLFLLGTIGYMMFKK